MTVLGVTSNNTNKVVYDRNCGDGYVIECLEAAITAELQAVDPTAPAYVFGANRRAYWNIDTPWPGTADTPDGRPSRDAAAGRWIIATEQVGTNDLWSGFASGSRDTAIDARGDEMAAWWANRPNAVICWSFAGEPNNVTDWQANGATVSGGVIDLTSDGTKAACEAWRGATQRIYERWVSAGVPIWEGDQTGKTTTGGLLLCGTILTGGAYSQGAGRITGMLDAFHGTDMNNWLWSHIQMVSSDGYNQGPVWRAPEEVWGPGTDGIRAGFKEWADRKQTTQNNAGRVLLKSWWESGTRERNDGYTSESAYWTTLGISATKANWMKHLADYVHTSWPSMHSCVWFDSTGPNGSWAVDSSQESWDAFVAMTQHDAFAVTDTGGGGDPTPGYLPGVVPLASRVRLGTGWTGS